MIRKILQIRQIQKCSLNHFLNLVPQVMLLMLLLQLRIGEIIVVGWLRGRNMLRPTLVIQKIRGRLFCSIADFMMVVAKYVMVGLGNAGQDESCPYNRSYLYA